MDTVKMFIWAAIVGGFLGVLSLIPFPVKAQQPPFVMYPIHSRALGPYSHCLVVTAQGYAVVLEYPCPQ